MSEAYVVEVVGWAAGSTTGLRGEIEVQATDRTSVETELRRQGVTLNGVPCFTYDVVTTRRADAPPWSAAR